ncbi:folylpolyglutamate synthase, mitochondrial-like isoform X1 [Tetranychus urticae]|uniref:folylpolyglutamate synthase, mitochondrial-like isoform X1 n=2 Tax=Tetranychus urticae TaxID=32264 RepID=UPI00077BF9B2|nr:folylpolyglutamate synthase, mitochondrial-like isoform X1 [Tetranychus urticae]XP_015795376.1 folylpolyglutamate synthase, mitochondrial-like isoform X1 [Tetranychus urticae]
MLLCVRGWKIKPTFPFVRCLNDQMMDFETKSNNQMLLNGNAKIANGLTNSNQSYKETLSKLMEYDSNFSVLKKINPANTKDARQKLNLITELLKRLDIELDDLNNLNIIHIAGTKGKGSTCAYIESILNERGYKTGLYTSPHVVSVRERIRLSGRPVSVDVFVKYFWEVTSKLADVDKPGYFMFLTILSFYIFSKEKVDVAIVEAGIGGEFDCTNIVPKPVVTGITSLGIDHTSVLGDTLESIAWHKAGIIKPNVVCFTSSQPEPAMQVIHNRSVEKDTEVIICPRMENYENLTPYKINLGIDGHVQRVNASLALQISRYFHLKMTSAEINRKQLITLGKGFALDKEEASGLVKTNWPGRCQLITKGRVNYFLDGAHTVESLDNCCNWFKQKSYLQSSNEKIIRILFFFSAGLRQYEPLIQRVAQESFDVAIFPSNYIENIEIYPEMMPDSRFEIDKISDRINKTREMWQAIQKDLNRNPDNFHQFSSLNKALNFLDSNELIEKYGVQDDYKLHVLVTGSLLFVGNVLALINPDPSC